MRNAHGEVIVYAIHHASHGVLDRKYLDAQKRRVRGDLFVGRVQRNRANVSNAKAPWSNLYAQLEEDLYSARLLVLHQRYTRKALHPAVRGLAPVSLDNFAVEEVAVRVVHRRKVFLN